MTDHLHIYTHTGRCLASHPLGIPAIVDEVELMDSTRIQFQLMSLGYALTLWNAEDRTGIAVSKGHDYIMRVKPTGLVRDMLPAGVAQTMKDLCAKAVEVDRLTRTSEGRLMAGENRINTVASDLTDADIAAAKESKANVIISFGTLGNKIVLLNPASVQAAKDRFQEIEGEAPYDDCLVEVIGFDDAFHAYDVSNIE